MHSGAAPPAPAPSPPPPPTSPPSPPPLTQVNFGHALFFAALLDRLQIVQTLLEKGAKVVVIKYSCLKPNIIIRLTR